MCPDPGCTSLTSCSDYFVKDGVGKCPAKQLFCPEPQEFIDLVLQLIQGEVVGISELVLQPFPVPELPNGLVMGVAIPAHLWLQSSLREACASG